MSADRIQLQPGDHLRPGACVMGDVCIFTLETDTRAEVSLVLYRKGKKEPFLILPLDGSFRKGYSYSARVWPLDPEKMEYNYLIDGKVCQDPCARLITGRSHFGAPCSSSDPHRVRCGFPAPASFDWEDSDIPVPDYHDMVLYKLHVRGYTKQRASLGNERGTFSGLVRMIPYWQELGITAVELMPAYEFFEVSPDREAEGMVSVRQSSERINYWGYTEGLYFAPKASYCAGEDPVTEVKILVRALHKAGIACIMEFFFPETVPPHRILHILRFWTMEYHIDGFHMIGNGAPLDLVLRDSLLVDSLIMTPSPAPAFILDGKRPPRLTYAEYHSGFMEDMRRFLKSDEGMVEAAKYRIGRTCELFGVINYMAFQDGFTLHDMVSYNYRHNEDNGEDNKDGSSFNYSWNCGVEGPSRKSAVRNLRRLQMRNAFALLFLAQGVPMIYAGDEVGNSQKGNNNAYCQDNPVGWTDWKQEKKYRELTDFVVKLAAFRKDHPVLRMGGESAQRMYQGKGFPVVSYHGERAWFCNSENDSRLLGVLYAGPCALRSDGTEDDYIYVAYNFHWEERKLALPDLPEGIRWKKVIDTSDMSTDGFCVEKEFFYEKNLEVPPRTVLVMVGEKWDHTGEKRKDAGEKRNEAGEKRNDAGEKRNEAGGKRNDAGGKRNDTPGKQDGAGEKRKTNE